jgi:hypothetical protein
MRDWHLTHSDPFALRLAADVRLTPTDYADDHIWELTLSGGEPPALALRTTYGLRARDMRLFPSFAEGERVVTDPMEFDAPPTLRACFVNYHRLTFQPLPALAVTAHYWAADSHSVGGQFTLTNHSAEPRLIRVGLTALLKPLDNPKNIGVIKRDEFHALEGQTGNLTTLTIFEGPTEIESALYPTLTRTLRLEPGQKQFVRWVSAARPTLEAAQQCGLAVLAREWEAEFARIELTNAGLLDIETGDPDWDAAFACAQTVALRNYVGPTPHLPQPSFVFTRHPDKGYSRRGDGADHNWQWDGQVATEAYVNLPQIAPIAPDLAKGVLKNWLAVQDEKGFIDWKPGLAGQRNKTLCLPLLATMAWQLYEHTEDRAFLEETYLGLRRFFDAWFAPKHDLDEDGVPEWSHTVQSAFDDNPSFVRWRAWAQGADITLAEAPDLASYLYRECLSLQSIAAALELVPDTLVVQRAAILRQAVAAMWRDETASYHYIDRDSHELTRGDVLAVGRGNLSVEVHRRFAPSARMVVKAIGPKEARPNLEVTLTGRGKRGRRRVEVLRRSHVQWYFGIGTTTSEKLYAELERVDIAGLNDEFEVTVAVVDYTRQDQTLLLPLWAGMPDAARAETLIRQTLMDPARYWRPYGLPNCSAQDPAYKADNREGSGGVWLMWNTMLGEGLIDYGYRAEAAELITRLMTAMIHSLKTDKAFREAYNSDALEGLGDRDYIWGVAPVALFMRAVGVRFIGPRRVWVAGHNPFPWPVTVRWKGVMVTKAGEAAVITFPTGKQVVVTGAAPQFVEDGG